MSSENLGAARLPIEDFKAMIMGCDSPYIIVEAETGSGKSTMVPQWFHELGYRVLVTEPLIEAVRGTSEYVAELMGVPFGTTVGFRTAEARQDSGFKTEILFCTDGLALVRELIGVNQFDVLVIDELHEWNKNQSTLEAWAWKMINEGGDTFFKKIVVLSATLDSDGLSRKRGNAPVFKVPGRQYPIADQPAGQSVTDDVCRLVREGFDVLVFQPGKAQIAKTIGELFGLDAELIPFHGELLREDKNRAYRVYDRPKVVVSTNALETGRTLLPSPGRKLAVVDSGLENRVELRDGIETIVLAPIALARGKQRRGRTGRVGEGVYIDHCPAAERAEYPVPEILRTRLDQTVLRLAIYRYDATDLPFFHDLDVEEIRRAKRTLTLLGAMTETGEVTKTGKVMARLPISVDYARMVVEAHRLGVMEDVCSIVAILEQKSIRDKSAKWMSLTQERESDLLAELDVYKAAENTRGGDALKEIGVFVSSYFRAKDLRRKLREALPAEYRQGRQTGDRQAVLKACVAGLVDHLYHHEGCGEYRNGETGTRTLARESVLNSADRRPEWIVGKPMAISGINKRGRRFTLSLVSQATKVDPMWLGEIAPQLIVEKAHLRPRFNPEADTVETDTEVYFNGTLVKTERCPDASHPEAAEVFCSWLAGQMVV